MTPRERLHIADKVALPLDSGRRRWTPARAPRLAAIVGLFLLRRPAAILGRVRAVVVDAVERVKLRRTLSHVREERFEAVAPAVADRNSAATVVGVARCLRIQAPVLHLLPRAEFRRLAPAVRAVRGGRALTVQAPARLRSAAEELLSDGRGVPAVAPAEPRSMLAVMLAFLQHDQSSEPLSRQIASPRKAVFHAGILASFAMRMWAAAGERIDSLSGSSSVAARSSIGGAP
jgi:hypothetical protein